MGQIAGSIAPWFNRDGCRIRPVLPVAGRPMTTWGTRRPVTQSLAGEPPHGGVVAGGKPRPEGADQVLGGKPMPALGALGCQIVLRQRQDVRAPVLTEGHGACIHGCDKRRSGTHGERSCHTDPAYIASPLPASSLAHREAHRAGRVHAPSLAHCCKKKSRDQCSNEGSSCAFTNRCTSRRACSPSCC